VSKLKEWLVAFWALYLYPLWESVKPAKRGDDGLTDSERAEHAEAWRRMADAPISDKAREWARREHDCRCNEADKPEE
jgi:hypothetical protein